jgi:hypothetical protein
MPHAPTDRPSIGLIVETTCMEPHHWPCLRDCMDAHWRARAAMRNPVAMQ